MENIKLNHEYIKINSSTGEVFIPVEITNNVVRFSNNAQCAVDVFNKTFIEKNSNVNVNVNENVSNPSKSLDDEAYLLNIFNDYTNNVSSIHNTPDIPLTTGQQAPLTPPVLDTTTLSPEMSTPVGHTGQHPLEAKYGNDKMPNFDDYDDNENVYHDRLNGGRNLNGGRQNPVKHKNDFNLIDEYEKVQLSKKPVKLNVDIEMLLPDPLHIQVIRDMYSESSNPDYVEYMVNKFIYEHIIKNNETFKTIMMSEISRWLKQFNKKTKIIKKPVLGRPEAVKTSKKAVEPVVEPVVEKKKRKRNVNSK